MCKVLFIQSASCLPLAPFLAEEADGGEAFEGVFGGEGLFAENLVEGVLQGWVFLEAVLVEE